MSDKLVVDVGRGMTIPSFVAGLKNYLERLLNPKSYLGDQGDFSSAAAREVADENELTIVEPKSNQIQVDIDGDFEFAVFNARYEKFLDFYEVKDIRNRPSQSGLPHRHITITLDFIPTDIERLFLQLYLGSDPTREFLGLQRVRAGDPTPTLFFEENKS